MCEEKEAVCSMGRWTMKTHVSVDETANVREVKANLKCGDPSKHGRSQDVDQGDERLHRHFSRI